VKHNHQKYLTDQYRKNLLDHGTVFTDQQPFYTDRDTRVLNLE